MKLFPVFAATCLVFAPPIHAADSGRVSVYILSGQSNMEGKAKLTLLDYQVKQPATRPLFAHFAKDGAWAVRDDVWIKFLDRKGPLTTGFGSPGCIGPELQFGWTVGDRSDEPVLLLKTAWGGRSLWRDFRPPSAGLPRDTALAAMLIDAQKKKPETTLDDIKKLFGQSYREMLDRGECRSRQSRAQFSALAGRKAELAGFVWFQGWNDMINVDYTVEYASNLAHFIRDVRQRSQSARAACDRCADGHRGHQSERQHPALQRGASDRSRAARIQRQRGPREDRCLLGHRGRRRLQARLARTS